MALLATFAERVDRLIHLLGLNQTAFCERIGKKSRGSYSNWKKGVLPTTQTEELICRRWMISADSLRGYPGTDDLEPSPALRRAQEAMLYDLSRENTPGTPEARLRLIYERVRAAGMEDEAWCEWLRTSLSGWNEVLAGKASATRNMIQGAAFLAGWFRDQHAWEVWISTGDAEALLPASERELLRMAEALARSGMTFVDLQRKLQK